MQHLFRTIQLKLLLFSLFRHFLVEVVGFFSLCTQTRPSVISFRWRCISLRFFYCCVTECVRVCSIVCLSMEYDAWMPVVHSSFVYAWEKSSHENRSEAHNLSAYYISSTSECFCINSIHSYFISIKVVYSVLWATASEGEPRENTNKQTATHNIEYSNRPRNGRRWGNYTWVSVYSDIANM